MMMKNLFIPMMVVLLVAACGPRDLAMDGGSRGGNVDTNSYLVVQNVGELSSTCKKGSPFTTIDSPKEFDAQIFSGKITASFQAGDQNCFRIGDVIDLQDRQGGASRGKVKILKAEMFHISKLTQTQADAFNTTVDVLRGRIETEMARVKAIPKGQPGGFDPREMVSITYFQYLGADGNLPPGTGENVDLYLKVDTVGDLAETCPGNPYTTIDSPKELDEQVIAGKVTASFQAGDRNCFRIGDVIDLKGRLDTNSRGKVKILKAEILHHTKLTVEQAKAFNMTLEVFASKVKAELDRVKAIPKGEPGGFNPKGMVSITYFQYLGMDGTTPVTPAPATIVEVTTNATVSPTCPATFTPSKSIDIPADKDPQIISGDLMGFMAPGDRNCFQIGSIVSLKAKPKVEGEITPERAKLKIAWVEIVPVDLLNQNHATIMNMTLPELKAAAQLATSSVTFANNTVNITIFEYIPTVTAP